jgi:hypothetical protein
MRTSVLRALAVAAVVAFQGVPHALAASAVTPDEARKFAAVYIEALTKPNLQKANQMIDWDALLEKATTGGEVAEGWREGFLAGASRSMGTFLNNLAELVQNGGSFHLVNVRSAGGETRIVLRMLQPGAGINYHELPLVKDDTGFVRARDVYVFATAESLSDSLHRFYLMAAASDPSLLESLAGKRPSFEWAADFATMMEKVRTGEGAGAISIYRRLPESVRRDKAVMVAYVVASSQINDDAAYTKAMDELRAAHPRESGLELMYIDSHIIAGRYDEALRSIGRLDAAVGGDPYLEVMRATVNLQKGTVQQAAVHAARATEQEPELEDAWWARVSVALAQENFPETARLLRHLRDELEIEIADLTTIPEYAKFVKSPAYRQFVK